MSDLVERYLNSIKPLLPGDQKDDIIAELREEIRSRAEEQEAALGRKLKPGEVEAILKAIGNPLAVAARYGSGRSLIGPSIYPAYILALKITLAVMACGQLVAAFVRTAVDVAKGEPFLLASHIGQAIGDFWVSALFMGGLITLIAAIVERTNPELKFENWKPSSLPRPAAPPKLKDRRLATRAENAFAFAINVAIFLWLLGYVEARASYPEYLSPDRWMETAGLAFSPVWWWQGLFALMLAGVAAQAARHAVLFAWPTSQRRAAAAKLVCNAIGIVFCAAVYRADPLFTATGALGSNPKVADVVQSLNQATHLGFAAVGAILALTSVIELWRLFGPRRPAVAAA
jgi:hypothetical protein